MLFSPLQTITYAQMEALEDLASSIPDRVTIKKKARVTRLLKEGEAVVGVEYEYAGEKHEERGPVILATGSSPTSFVLFASARARAR